MALLTREESMLLVIDIQDNFYPKTRDDVDRDAYSAFVDRAAWLVAAATALSIPVVVTEEQAEANGPTEKRVRQYLNEATPILRKDFFAASDNPHIRQAIDATGRSTVVVLGLETDVCVAHSALQLALLGNRVVAASDCLFSPGEAHAQGLRRMELADVELLSAKGVFYDWIRGVASLDHFCSTHPQLSRPPGFHL